MAGGAASTSSTPVKSVRKKRSAGPSSMAPLFKKAKTSDNVELDDDKVAELLDDIEEEVKEIKGLEYSSNTACASSYKDPLVCVNCALEGRVCMFSVDKRTSRRKAACNYCVQAHNTCRKAPRNTFYALAKYQKVSGLTSNKDKLLCIVKGVRDDLLRRQDLPRATELQTYPRDKAVSGYDVEWSDYEAEVAELTKRPRPEVKFARRAALAIEESVKQLKIIVSFTSSHYARFLKCEKLFREKFNLPPTKSPKTVFKLTQDSISEMLAKLRAKA
ncbi:hypothetical protein E8E12_002616, partial [Didymella heteroderae]